MIAGRGKANSAHPLLVLHQRVGQWLPEAPSSSDAGRMHTSKPFIFGELPDKVHRHSNAICPKRERRQSAQSRERRAKDSSHAVRTAATNS